MPACSLRGLRRRLLLTAGCALAALGVPTTLSGEPRTAAVMAALAAFWVVLGVGAAALLPFAVHQTATVRLEGAVLRAETVLGARTLAVAALSEAKCTRLAARGSGLVVVRLRDGHGSIWLSWWDTPADPRRAILLPVAREAVARSGRLASPRARLVLALPGPEFSRVGLWLRGCAAYLAAVVAVSLMSVAVVSVLTAP